MRPVRPAGKSYPSALRRLQAPGYRNRKRYTRRPQGSGVARLRAFQVEHAEPFCCSASSGGACAAPVSDLGSRNSSAMEQKTEIRQYLYRLGMMLHGFCPECSGPVVESRVEHQRPTWSLTCDICGLIGFHRLWIPSK